MTCPHETTEPVEVRTYIDSAPEIVARLCVDCYERLPASWGCGECEWYDERRVGDAVAQVRLGRPCSIHWRYA